MKRLMMLLIAISFVILVGCNSTSDQGSGNETESSEIVKTSENFITLLDEGQFEKATDYFDEPLKKERTPESLKDEWDTLIEQIGELNNQEYSTTAELNGYQEVMINGYFEETVVMFNISFNDQGEIVGFYIQ